MPSVQEYKRPLMFLNAKNVYVYDPCLYENDVTINTKGVFVGNDLQSEQAGKRKNSGSRKPNRLYTDLWGHVSQQVQDWPAPFCARCSFLLLINY